MMLTPTRRLDLSRSEESDCGRIKESSWPDNADRGKSFAREAIAVERLLSEADFERPRVNTLIKEGGLDKPDRRKSAETALL